MAERRIALAGQSVQKTWEGGVSEIKIIEKVCENWFQIRTKSKLFVLCARLDRRQPNGSLPGYSNGRGLVR